MASTNLSELYSTGESGGLQPDWVSFHWLGLQVGLVFWQSAGRGRARERVGRERPRVAPAARAERAERAEQAERSAQFQHCPSEVQSIVHNSSHVRRAILQQS